MGIFYFLAFCLMRKIFKLRKCKIFFTFPLGVLSIVDVEKTVVVEVGVLFVECKDFVLQDFERDCFNEDVFGVLAGKHFITNLFSLVSGVTDTLDNEPRLEVESFVSGELKE